MQLYRITVTLDPERRTVLAALNQWRSNLWVTIYSNHKPFNGSDYVPDAAREAIHELTQELEIPLTNTELDNRA